MKYREILAEGEIPDAIFEQAARSLLANIDWSGGGGETVRSMLGYDDDDESPNEAELYRWALDRVNGAYEDIEWRFKGDVIPVYRVITAAPNWKPTGHPGLYWSWDPHAAEAHWGHFGTGQVKWCLMAEFTFEMIDWVSTLSANGSPDSENESEITLKENVPVTLLSYKKVR